MKPAGLTLQQTRQHYGFTLIELLVVIVIVSILFTYTTLAIRSESPEEIIKKEAHRMERLVQLALQEAILRGEEYGIEISLDGYRFVRMTDNRWQPIIGDKILRLRQLPLEMELEMSLEDSEIEIKSQTSEIANYMSKSSALEEYMSDKTLGDEENETDEEQKNTAKPHIYLLSSGEITPEFEIRFSILGVENSYIVTGDFDGSLKTEISDL